jgi:tRNA(Ile)-lysidine synthase
VFSKFANQIRQTITRHHMLESHDCVLVGVSGGPDSVGLLLVLKELGCELAVAHLNHSLRGAASDEDEEFTRELTGRLGVRSFSKNASPGSGNVEAWGRKARQVFFASLAEVHGFAKIALAHNRSDRIETFLLNMFRGAGAGGLVSMAPVSGKIIRPLIEASREDIESYLQENKQKFCTDASNFDLAFARNRLRNVVIPALASDFNPNLVDTLTRTLQILDDEDVWLAALTEQWLRENGSRAGKDFRIPVSAVISGGDALIRRVFRGALRRAGSDLHDVSFAQIEAIRTLLEPGKSGKLVEIPSGLQVAREFDVLVFRRQPDPPRDYEYDLAIPGQVRIGELGQTFRAEIIAKPANQSGNQRVFVDADSIGHHVRIRNWRPGDYYRPVGLPSGKLKKLFQRARIPRSHRARWPVVVAESTIVWVASFPISREFAPRGHSQRVVALEALPSADTI